jgi:hypothetical protein
MFNLYKYTGELQTINVAFNVPQLGSRRYKYDLVYDKEIKIILNNIEELSGNTIDYVIDNEYYLHIGIGHWKLNDKKQTIKMAGTIILNNDGKILKISNESGHFNPDVKTFIEFINKIKKYLNPNTIIESINYNISDVLHDIRD